jgi:16S rRNA (adenine1518-N6/adenine1519-N6)-dimethyltransferase
MDVIQLLKKYSFRPSDMLGQNFLVNDATLDAIVDAAEIAPEDQVMEIGPGIANLTARLAKRAAYVLAVEKDERFFPIIKAAVGKDHLRSFSKTPNSKANVELVFSDILRFNFQEYLDPGYKVVANIPYYITGKIIELLLAAKKRPSRIILLVQKEVAERATAKPGQLSILGISVQLYSSARMVQIVPKEDFYPMPKVDSAILVLDVLPKPLLDIDEKKFFRLIKACFAGKRKQLRNTLKNNLKCEPEFIDAMEKATGISFQERPQDLGLDLWFKIYSYILEKQPDLL